MTERTVRYHLRRAAKGGEDGRADKPFLAESMAAVVDARHEAHADRDRPVGGVSQAHLLELCPG